MPARLGRGAEPLLRLRGRDAARAPGAAAKIVPAGAERAFLAPLPVAAARAARGRRSRAPSSATVLERLGVRTLGELAALPAGAVADRFGRARAARARAGARPRHAAAPARRPASALVERDRPARGGLGPPARAHARAADRPPARAARAARARASQAAARRALRRAGHLAARGHAAPGDRRRASACGWRWRRSWPSCRRRSSSSASTVVAFGPPVADQLSFQPPGRAASAAGASREALRQTRAAAGSRVGAAGARGGSRLARPRAARVPDAVPGMSWRSASTARARRRSQAGAGRRARRRSGAREVESRARAVAGRGPLVDRAPAAPPLLRADDSRRRRTRSCSATSRAGAGISQNGA